MSDSRRHYYRSNPPEDDEEVRCDVCGATIRADITQTSDQSIIQYTRNGTTYHALDAANTNVNVEARVPSRTNCWLCGSNRWRTGGTRGDL